MTMKRLKAEIWEVQMILYLILSQMITIDWIRYLLYFWSVVTFFGIMKLIAEDNFEKELKGGDLDA